MIDHIGEVPLAWASGPDARPLKAAEPVDVDRSA